MYSTDLIYGSLRLPERDESWITKRLEQIAAQSTEPLCTRWQFHVQDAGGIAYSWLLFKRVASYALVFFSSDMLFKVVASAMETYSSLYSRVRGTQEMFQHNKNLKQILLTLVVAQQKISSVQRIPEHLSSYSVEKEKIKDLTEAYKKAVSKIKPELAYELLSLINENSALVQYQPTLTRTLVYKALEYNEEEITLPKNLLLDFSLCGKTLLSRTSKVNLNGSTLCYVPLDKYRELIEKLNEWDISTENVLFPSTSAFKKILFAWTAGVEKECPPLTTITGKDLKYMQNVLDKEVTLELRDCSVSELDEESASILGKTAKGSFYLLNPTEEMISLAHEIQSETLTFKGISYLPSIETPGNPVPSALVELARFNCKQEITLSVPFMQWFDQIKFATLISYITTIELKGYDKSPEIIIEMVEKMATPLKYITAEELAIMAGESDYNINNITGAPYTRKLVFRDSAGQEKKWEAIMAELEKRWEGKKLPFEVIFELDPPKEKEKR